MTRKCRFATQSNLMLTAFKELPWKLNKNVADDPAPNMHQTISKLLIMVMTHDPSILEHGHRWACRFPRPSASSGMNTKVQMGFKKFGYPKFPLGYQPTFAQKGRQNPTISCGTSSVNELMWVGVGVLCDWMARIWNPNGYVLIKFHIRNTNALKIVSLVNAHFHKCWVRDTFRFGWMSVADVPVSPWLFTRFTKVWMSVADVPVSPWLLTRFTKVALVGDNYTCNNLPPVRRYLPQCRAKALSTSPWGSFLSSNRLLSVKWIVNWNSMISNKHDLFQDHICLWLPYRQRARPRECFTNKELRYVHTCAGGRGRRRSGGGGRKIAFNTNHYMRSHIRGRGAEAERGQNPLRKKWVQHPIFRVRFETARSKPPLSSRNGWSARVRSAYVWTYPR